MKGSEISALALALSVRHGTRVPFRVCGMEGIDILVRNDFKRQKGAFARVCGRPFVFLGGRLPEEEQRLVCAHELGHALLHAGEGVFADTALFGREDPREKEANLFAAELLLPEEEVLALAREETGAESIAGTLGCPVDLLMIKLTAMRERGYDLRLPGQVRRGFIAREPRGMEQ